MPPTRADTRPILTTLERANNPVAKWSGVKPVNAMPGKVIWRCVYARRLDDSDNEGNHNVYIDVINEFGKRIDKPDVTVAFGWGDGEQSTQFEKPPFEPGSNFVLSAGMSAWCTIDGQPADIVGGLHGERGHTSYYVVFQRQSVGSTQRPDGGAVTVSIEALRRAQKAAAELARALEALG